MIEADLIVLRGLLAEVEVNIRHYEHFLSEGPARWPQKYLDEAVDELQTNRQRRLALMAVICPEQPSDRGIW